MNEHPDGVSRPSVRVMSRSILFMAALVLASVVSHTVAAEQPAKAAPAHNPLIRADVPDIATKALKFNLAGDGLRIDIPEEASHPFGIALKIEGRGLV